MRLLIALFIMIQIISLFCDFNEHILVSAEETYFSGKESVCVKGDSIYIVYYHNDNGDNSMRLSFSDNNGQSFEEYIVYENLENGIWDFDDPVIEVLDDGTAYILFTEKYYYTRLLLAASSDYNNFSVYIIDEKHINDVAYCIYNEEVYFSYTDYYPKKLGELAYFTCIEKSENADGGLEAGKVMFWGPDVFYGDVHSNDDIWIQQAGGGNNNSWPTFYGMVSTAGIFRNYPSGQHLVDSGAPMDDIFRADREPGWIEGVPEISFPDHCSDIATYGMSPFEDPTTDIVYVKIDGQSFTSMKGDIQLTEIKPFTVYSWFPMDEDQANNLALQGLNWFEEADSIWTNYVPIYDTVWTEGPTGVVVDASVFVPCKLWIEGSIAGRQSWGCADTVYIVGDITYENTEIGESPVEDPVNTTDYFGLVSNERIYIKYKHRDPITNELKISNCYDIYLYGVYAALGKGDSLVYGEQYCHYDGIITFEYQHPHGSTPSFQALSPYTLEDTLYTYIDLHKFIYQPSSFVPPQLEGFLVHGNLPMMNGMCGFPYEQPEYINSYPNNGPDYVFPYGTDYPWYNPVWPESSYDIVYCTERGDLNVFGSLIQRRRGYMHRSGFDPYNHPEEIEWNLEEYHFDGHHASTGYSKHNYYDSRLLENDLVDFPYVHDTEGEQTVKVFKFDHLTQTVENVIQVDYDIFEDPFVEMEMTSNDDLLLLSYFSKGGMGEWIWSYDGINFQNSGQDNLANNINNLSISENFVYYTQYYLDPYYLNVWRYDFLTNSYDILSLFSPDYTEIHSFNLGEEIFALVNLNLDLSPLQMNADYSYGTDDLEQEFTLDLDFTGNNIDPSGSEIAITFDESDSLYILYNQAFQNSDDKRLYLIRGQLPDNSGTGENEIPEISERLRNYPNPFNPSTVIYFSIEQDEQYERIDLVIYNLKGQLIKNFLISDVEVGHNTIGWDGKDSYGKDASSGVYFTELKIDGNTVSTIKMMLLK